VRALHVAGAALSEPVQKALDQAFGPHAGWVAMMDDGILALRRFPGVDPGRAAEVAAEALRAVPGVWKAVTQAGVADAGPLVRHAWFPGRSGDVMFIPAPLASLGGSGPDDAWVIHGSPWTDDALVPLLAQAPGFRLKRGEDLTAVQVAPSAALLLGVAPPAAALAPPAVVPTR
jgi:hypothetical protein